MTADPTEAIRTQARADCEALLAGQPWSDFATRALVLLVRPPAVAWASPLGMPSLWMVLDASEARALPPRERDPLVTAGLYRTVAPRDRYELVVFTSEAIGSALEGVPRSSLELRWTVRHAEPLHDPLHRAEQLQRAAGDWVERGIARRVGVVVRHRPLGYAANAMAVWDVPDAAVAKVGAALAAEESVTLCYRRPRRLPGWRYNLFCMVHGREREAVRREVEALSVRHGLADLPREVLFSPRCFTQRGARYG